MTLNVQNAKALTITEGDVKTIHDKDSRLLWGAVGYSTKYEGDTTQKTLSGKNLIDTNALEHTLPFSSTNHGINFTLADDGSITLNGKNDSTGASVFSIYNSTTPLIIAGGTYAGDLHPADNVYRAVSMIVYDGAHYRGFQQASVQSLDASNASCYLQVANGESTQFTDYKIYPQLELGSTATAYEPYCGGTASPNPDYPQDVNVVTGEQTITISADGQQNQAFTVDLDSIELCKIGDYQDYIYKANGNWYKHTEIGKRVLDGTEADWVKGSTGTAQNVYIVEQADAHTYMTSSMTKCDYFTYNDAVYDLGQIGFYFNKKANNVQAIRFGLGTSSDFDTLSEWTTWLSTHNTTVYYALDTATDTQITDTDLTTQLEAIEQWLIRYGYQASVTGDLPIIIDRTELS